MATISSNSSVLSYLCQYAGVPFLTDKAEAFHMPGGDTPEGQDSKQHPPQKHQPLPSLLEELERLQPLRQMNDFVQPSAALAGEVGAINVKKNLGADGASQNVHVGEWFYPTNASRWSVFRGLMTSSMVKAVLTATGGLKNSSTFTMRANPLAPRHQDGDQDSYTLSSSMYCLPPRCISETGSSVYGLYLVTLVDERWHFQGIPALVSVTDSSTWSSLLQDIASALGISLSFDPVASAYGSPRADLLCDLWKYGATLLDVAAFHIGRTVVRKLDGTYTLEDYNSSLDTIQSNRGSATQVVRIAGGDHFTSGVGLPVGNLSSARNAVVPTTLTVYFPTGLAGTCCGGDPSSLYSLQVPITSGGDSVSGLTGVKSCSVFSPVSAEGVTGSGGTPSNASALLDLALQTARDFYGQQVTGTLDETYPGTFNWEPEGVHDIVWTYSENLRRASTRIVRTEWNLAVRDLQANSCANLLQQLSQSSNQTVRDSVSGVPFTSLANSLAPGDSSLSLTNPSYLPTQNRWRGKLSSGQSNEEILLLEGTSGGSSVSVAARGIDGTSSQTHAAGEVLFEITPHNISGVFITTYEKGQFVYPQEYSGGAQGLRIVPQVQTLEVQDSRGLALQQVTLQTNGTASLSFDQATFYGTLQYGFDQNVLNGTTLTNASLEMASPSDFSLTGDLIGSDSFDGTASSGMLIQGTASGVGSVAGYALGDVLFFGDISAGTIFSVIKGTSYCSGIVVNFDYPNEADVYLENVWVIERNGGPLLQGGQYGGQFIGYSKEFRDGFNQVLGEAAPIYLVDTGASNVQTVRDSYSGKVKTTLSGDIGAASSKLLIYDPSYFPTQNRWRARVSSGLSNDEIMLLEGTSGGFSVNVVARGIDGTVPAIHNHGDVIAEVVSHNTSGVIYTTYEKGQFVYTHEYSGNIQGIRVVPQIQTVRCLALGQTVVGSDLNTFYHSGQVNLFDPQSGYMPLEYVWLKERNRRRALVSGRYYIGTLVGYSKGLAGDSLKSGFVHPVYLVDDQSDDPSIGIITSGPVSGCNYQYCQACWTGSGWTIIDGTCDYIIEANCTSGIPPGTIIEPFCVPDCFGSGEYCFFEKFPTVVPYSSGILSSGTSGGGSLITTSCCPGTYLSQNLVVTLSSATCSCLNGSFTISYNGSNMWAGITTKCGGSLSVTLSCLSDNRWQLGIDCHGSAGTGFAASFSSCDPLSLAFMSISIPAACCGLPGLASVDATVTNIS